MFNEVLISFYSFACFSYFSFYFYFLIYWRITSYIFYHCSLFKFFYFILIPFFSGFYKFFHTMFKNSSPINSFWFPKYILWSVLKYPFLKTVARNILHCPIIHYLLKYLSISIKVTFINMLFFGFIDKGSISWRLC